MPTISVVIPTYNSETTIQETIESVQKQTFSDFEIIVIDDGSQDGTIELVKSLVKLEPRLKIFCYENAGVAVARNRGIELAQGEFISLLDADDLWTPDKLELQLKALKDHPQAGVAYSWTNPIDEQGKILFLGTRPIWEGNVYGKLLQTNFLSNGSNILVRREAIESICGFPTDFPVASDWDFYLKLAFKCSFVVVPQYQILYRQRSNSMSSNIEVLMQENCAVLEKAYYIAPAELKSSRNKNLSNLYFYFAELYLKRSKDVKSINQVGRNLWISIRFYPPSLFNKNIQRTLVKFCWKRLLSIKNY
ncbi:glycosyl transferase family A [Pleurocapsa sp. CCALA 161]|uniref:glycosyltransferase family 2 protein n=1 Tax=Pleurocapsa sp. CCALA 161 TaxID=2107688 RepID=UPI000D07676E|nr:glycosyltransferase [Pleurocapsa sp. CCALA 161]PSB10599.1 glycosyl transferase family A [Pleurocapsa sp. CCALA 161]